MLKQLKLKKPGPTSKVFCTFSAAPIEKYLL